VTSTALIPLGSRSPSTLSTPNPKLAIVTPGVDRHLVIFASQEKGRRVSAWRKARRGEEARDAPTFWDGPRPGEEGERWTRRRPTRGRRRAWVGELMVGRVERWG